MPVGGAVDGGTGEQLVFGQSRLEELHKGHGFSHRSGLGQAAWAKHAPAFGMSCSGAVGATGFGR
jgi:hypothetical protein